MIIVLLAWGIQAAAYHHIESLLQTPPNPITTYDFLTEPQLFRHTKDLLSFTFKTYNQTFDVDLEPNTEFQIKGAMVQIETESGTEEIPLLTNNVYKGVIKSNGIVVPNSWARIVVSDEDKAELEGAVSMDSVLFHIKSIRNYKKSKRDIDVEIASPFSRPESTKRSKLIALKEEDPHKLMDTCAAGSNCNRNHFLTKRSELISTCGVDTKSGSNLAFMKSLQSLKPSKNAAAGCPASKKLLLMGVAADCTYVSDKGSRSEALNAILTNWNLVTKVFESTFNIQVGVAKVMLQESCTPSDPVLSWNADCSKTYTISDRLSDFSKWRGDQKDSFGLWHLMTKCMTTPAVGIAWLGMLCSQTTISQGNQFVSGTGVSAIVPVEWKVIAHEIGHNFGAIHDCTSQTCNNDCSQCSPSCDCKSQFLMNPLDTSITDQFSPGSISLICAGITKSGSCLVDPGSASLVSTGICGNGVKEGKEQCDCGLPKDCPNDPCCDAATCTLKANAQCSNKNDQCCTDTCQIQPSTVVCHKSNGVCDRTVYCPGTNASCPLNTFIPDGTSCKTVEGTTAECSSGICTSRDLQCKGTGLVVTTSACPAFGNECALNCQDKNGFCYALNGFFLDGTTCGGAGRCKKGECKGTNIFAMGMLWVNTYPQYGYPIIAVIVLFILSLIFSCIRNLFQKSIRPSSASSDNTSISDTPPPPRNRRSIQPISQSQEGTSNRYSGIQDRPQSFQAFGANDLPAPRKANIIRIN